MKFTNIVLTFLVVFVLFSMQAKAADIALTDITVDKETGYNPGEQATISFKVANSAIQAKTVIIKSTDLEQTISGITYKIPVSQTQTLTIPANSSNNPISGQIKINIPSIFVGTYSATLSATKQGVTAADDTESYQLIVNAKTELKVDSQNFVITPGKSGVIKTFAIKNTGSNPVTLSQSSFSHDIDLIDDNDNSITLTFPNPGTINPGESKNVDLIITVPSDQESKTYSGIVRLKDGSGAEVVSFSLSLQIKPEICKNGNIGNDLNLDVTDPDNGDDFSPGDTITVRFTVDNNGNNDKDVKVEAILYDTIKNDKVERETDSSSINEDEDQTFEFEIKTSTDLKDSSSRYKIFVKAYEDGKESSNCQEEQVDIEIKRESHQVTMDELSFVPSAVNCGDQVRASVRATNTGRNDEKNLRLKMFSLPLGVESITDTFRLDQDDDILKDFTFMVPTTVKTGQYVVEAQPVYSGDTSKTATALLNVNCGAASTQESEPSSQELSLVKQSKTLFEDKQYDQALGVLSAAETLREGTQYGDLAQQIKDAKSGSTPTGSVTGSQGYLPTSKISSLFGSSKNAAVFWIIGDIVLVVIALYFIKLIFSRREK